jgi:hypothetical protein
MDISVERQEVVPRRRRLTDRWTIEEMKFEPLYDEEAIDDMVSAIAFELYKQELSLNEFIEMDEFKV